MVITDKAYQELEQCVGPDNVSREPAVLDGYAWQPFANNDPKMWVNRPVAAVLPASTEEVQAVVKVCNKHGLKFKPFSTGWGAWNGCGEDNVVQIDLRRMNRILEIDAKNMYAVIEPYVCGAQLQAEAWKVGLDTMIVGAGPNCSPLAAATSAWGLGSSGIYMSYGARNVRGVEWVTPEGDVVKIGSCGSGNKMFVGDGPGPSLRGVLRGSIGAHGGLGIITKCSLKLYNWPGPPKMDADGMVVNSSVKKPPDNIIMYSCFFKNAEKTADALHMIGEAEIGYSLTRTSLGSVLVCFLPQMTDKILETSYLRTLITKTMQYYVSITLAGTSKADLEYKQKALRHIVQECGGFCTVQTNTPATNELFMLGSLRGTFPTLVFKHGGSFWTAMARNDAIEMQIRWTDAITLRKEKLLAEGKILDDAGDCPYCVLYENGTWAHSEETYQYDRRNPKQMKALEEIATDLIVEGCNFNTEPYLVHDPIFRTFISPLVGNPREYQKQISTMMDPKETADATFYTKEVPLDWNVIPEETQKLLKAMQKKYTWTEDGPPKR